MIDASVKDDIATPEVIADSLPAFGHLRDTDPMHGEPT